MEVRFVASYDSNTGKPNRRSKDERAHSARIVRQRKKQQQQQQSVKTSIGDGGFSNSFSNQCNLRTGPSKPVKVEVTELVEIGVDGEGYEDEGDGLRGSWDDLDCVEDLDDMDATTPTTFSTAIAIAPTLSPIFGALKTSTITPSTSSLAANAARYYLQCVMGNTILLSHQKTWFEAFCKDEMIFHCLTYSSYFFQDVKRVGGGEGVLREVTLKHRGRALRLVGERIRELGKTGDGEGRVEALVLTMTTLWMWSRERDGGSENGKWKVGGDLLIKSSARMPDAWLKDAFATVAAEDSHALALEWLIKRVGGMERVGRLLPGLRNGLASCDILSASAKATKPRFPSIWEKDFESIVLAVQKPLAPNPSLDETAFAHSIPNGLPELLLTTLTHLRHLTTALASPQTTPSSLIAARNALQHRLLSLPPWPQLKATNQTEGSFMATYETCRLTAILFANAVLFPIDRTVTWRVKLLGELREVLEVANLGAWRGEGAWRLMIWSLVIANLTTSELDQQEYFVRSLQKSLRMKGEDVMQWVELQTLLRSYLWCGSVCNSGLSMLWLSLLETRT